MRVPQTRTRLYVFALFFVACTPWSHHLLLSCSDERKMVGEIVLLTVFFVVYYSKLVTEFSDNRRDYFCDCQDPQVKSSVKENKAKCQFLNALYKLAVLKLK